MQQGYHGYTKPHYGHTCGCKHHHHHQPLGVPHQGPYGMPVPHMMPHPQMPYYGTAPGYGQKPVYGQKPMMPHYGTGGSQAYGMQPAPHMMPQGMMGSGMPQAYNPMMDDDMMEGMGTMMPGQYPMNQMPPMGNIPR